MSRTSTPRGGSTAICCDYPGCSGKFVTYSFAMMARKQAAAAGWTRRKGRKIADPDDANCVLSLGTVDICPDHPIELPKPNKQPRKKKAA